MTPQIVRKSDFAALKGVSPGRVTQWITEGKISGDALVGEGRSAMIRVEQATAQLRERLDVNQRFGGNGLSTDLGPEPPPARAAGPTRADTVETLIKAEKLSQAQLLTSRLQEEDRRQRGIYMLASEARAETARAVAEALNIFEGALSDFASALAAKYQIPQRDLVHALRGEFRTVRARASASRASAAAEAPKNLAVEEIMPTSVQ